MLDVLSDVKRLASAAETLFAARVAETDAWREGSADRSAAHWLARRAGISIAEAKAKLDMAEQLADLPATAEAFRAGRLSDQQAREVVAGAVADPQVRARRCWAPRRRTRCANCGTSRVGLKPWMTRRAASGVFTSGGGCGWVSTPTARSGCRSRGTAVAGAAIVAALRPFTDQAFKQAKKDGRVESHAAYQADGFVAMAHAAAAAGSTVPAEPKSQCEGDRGGRRRRPATGVGRTR